MAGKQNAGVQRRIIHSDLILAVLLLTIASITAFYFLIEPTPPELEVFGSLIANEDYSFEYSVPEIDLTQEPVVHVRKHRTHKRCHVPKVNKCHRVSNFTGPR